MKKTNRLFSAVLAVVMIFCLAQNVHAAEDEPWPYSEEQVIEVVQPLIDALSGYYVITDISVRYAGKDLYDSEYDCYYVTLTKYMRAQSPEELPYAAGMLDRIGIETLEECKEIARGALNVHGRPDEAGAQAKIAQRVADFLYELDISIDSGADESNYVALLKTGADGTLQEVMSRNYNYIYPMSDLFPEPAETMYLNGRIHASRIINSVMTVAQRTHIPPQTGTTKRLGVLNSQVLL